MEKDVERTLLTDTQVRARLGGIARSTLHTLRADPVLGFPQPIKLAGGNHGQNFTDSVALDRWIERRHAEAQRRRRREEAAA